jgi:hypothetical protein
MAKLKFAVGILSLGAAGAAAYLGLRTRDLQTQADAAARAAAAQGQADRLAAELRTTESQVVEAAALHPLNAALDDHVDSATLLDLFDTEDWWRPFREGFVSTRVIVADETLAFRGTLDLRDKDGDVVAGARKRRVASAPVAVGDQRYLVAAARLAALPEREPVLVLARLLPAAPVAAPAALRPTRLVERNGPWAAAGLLGLFGLGLALSGLRSRDGGAVVVEALPKEPTLKFGTPLRPLPVGSDGRPAGTAPGARPPLATGNAISIPGNTGPGVAGAPHPPAAPLSAAPSSFGRYRLLDRLGEGGMSEIFTAEAKGVEGFSRTFVLKRLRPELARDKEAVAQFIDEARMQASLVHSNIVPVFDFGTVGGEYFLTQEYIAGRDVSRLMTRYSEQTGREGLEPRLAFFLAYEILQALAYAHVKQDKNGAPMGIVHRDVSAGNIIVSLQGEVKLSDFGIVKSNRRVTRTQVGMVKGNANFMSPEQARGLVVDARSDLFSLGQVLYFCLTNQLLYSGDNDLDVLYKAATGPTFDDYQRMHDLPDPAGPILEKALAFDARERFQTADEFAGVLAAHVGGGKSAAANLMHTLFGEELRHEAA